MPDDKNKMPPKSDVINTKLLSTGLRISHVDSNLHYTVIAVNDTEETVTLKPPTGDLFKVSFEEIRVDYALD